MSRDQKIKIAMVICAVIVLCAVIITSTGMFNGTGIGGYANADKYTAGPAEVTGRVKKLEVNWTSGKVIVAYHAENTVLLEESAKRELSENEKMRWWLDGETLRVQFAASGTHWNMPEKTLTITLPEEITFENASIQTTSADVEIPALKAEKLELGSTSGSISASVEAKDAKLGSTSGDMKVAFTGDTDSIKAGSTSGSIGIEAGTVKKIEAGSTSGGIGITAAECEEAKAGSTSGNVYVTLGKLEKLSVSATSGSVIAKLPAEPGFMLNADMTSGSFSSEIALTKDGKQYVCGDGSARVSIGTTSGNIRIEPYEEK